MRILLGLVLIAAMTTGCAAKKKSPANPTNMSHETEKKSDGDKDGDGDGKNKDANEGDDDSSSPRSADPCEGGQ